MSRTGYSFEDISGAFNSLTGFSTQDGKGGVKGERQQSPKLFFLEFIIKNNMFHLFFPGY